MNPQKVTPSHLQRNAYLYIRQSTLKQVMENRESTRRQYALRQQAVALGWPTEQIVVIDSDLAQSGATGNRSGFQNLVADVGLGKAGIVLGLEVSRLARSSIDWHRLLEICALTNTLILDEDGIYDPNDFNDRLLLGLKGTMSEAELHILKSRMRGGLLNKARRGELKTALPTGFIYNEQGQVVLDPDQQVQKSIRLFFHAFRCTGSAFSTVKTFNEQGLKFPRRLREGFHKGELTWSPLVHHRALQVLHNPRYAGVFFFGKRQWRRKVNGASTTTKHPREEWHAFIKNAHEGYISWEEYEENQRTLNQNSQVYGLERRKSPPREGNALLQGLVICGVCGRRMTVRYRSKGAEMFPSYLCQQKGIENAKTPCQVIPGYALDRAVSNLLLEVITPLALEVTLAVQEELKSQAEGLKAFHLQQLKRLSYEVELAKRRYMQVDPDNRLVADELEANWNARLRDLTEAQQEYEKCCRRLPCAVNDEQRLEIQRIADNFPELWLSKDIPDRERKRILRLILEDVTLLKNEQIVAHIRFRGGAAKTLKVPLLPPFLEAFRTKPALVQEIDRLLENNTPKEISAILNEHGFTTGRGKPFTRANVYFILRMYGLKDRFTRLRETGLLTAEEVAEQLDARPDSVKLWRKKGLLKAYKVNDRNEYLYEPPGEDAPRGRQNKVPSLICATHS